MMTSSVRVACGLLFDLPQKLRIPLPVIRAASCHGARSRRTRDLSDSSRLSRRLFIRGCGRGRMHPLANNFYLRQIKLKNKNLIGIYFCRAPMIEFDRWRIYLAKYFCM